MREKLHRRFFAKRTLQRISASLLLFLLLGDLALHVGEAFLEAPPAPASAAAFTSADNSSHFDESNCPIPGHSSGLFHHHHFPGLIASQSVSAPSSLQRVMVASLGELRGSAIMVAHPGRAPPLA